MGWFDWTPPGIAINAGLSAASDLDKDIEAITAYIATLRGDAEYNPAALNVYNDYSTWVSNLAWYRKQFDKPAVLSEAKYYRDRLNSILGRTLPTAIIADTEASIKNPAAKSDPTPRPPLIPTQYKIAAAAGGGAILTLVILKKFRVL